MTELPAPGAYVCKCGRTFTIRDARAAAITRAEQAEAERDRVREECNKWLVRLNETITEVEQAEATIERVRKLTARYKAEWLDNNGGQLFETCYSDLVAVLDSTASLPSHEGEGTVAKCPQCGSLQWVSVSLDGGFTRKAQCVPCGAIHPGSIGPGDSARY